MTRPSIPPRRPAGGVALRSLLWITLGGWVGAWASFALLTSRLAFQLLPSAEVAGGLIGPLLAALHGYGAVAGVLLAGLAALLGRGRLLVVLPLVLALVCLASELGVTPQLAALRELAFGPEGNVEAASRYRQLHGLSMALFTGVLVGTLALVVLHARHDTPREPASP